MMGRSKGFYFHGGLLDGKLKKMPCDYNWQPTEDRHDVYEPPAIDPAIIGKRRGIRIVKYHLHRVAFKVSTSPRDYSNDGTNSYTLCHWFYSTDQATDNWSKEKAFKLWQRITKLTSEITP